MSLLIPALWLSSLVFGFFGSTWWLLVPPVLLLLTIKLQTIEVGNSMVDEGLDPLPYEKAMLMPNMIMAGWNSFLCCVSFGVGWLIAQAIG